MDKYRNYNINFSGLKNGKHEYRFSIDQAFFDLFEAEKEFSNAKLNANVLLEKHSTFLDFRISITGTIDLVCDISNQEFSHPVESEIGFLVKFGEEYDDSNDEIIVIPHHDSEYNVVQAIYEAVMLSVPMKKLYPNILENEEYRDLLEKYSPKINEEEEETEEIDPRWAVLKKLKE